MTDRKMELICTSCNANAISEEHFTKFNCPMCNKVEIIRCEKCRKMSNIYTCSECGFKGP